MGKLIDITGNRYGELIVLGLAKIKIKNRPAWRCLCDCGDEKIAAGDSLKCGDVKCCGKHKTKFYSEAVSARSKIQNRKYPPGLDSKSRLYTLWKAILWRCNNPSHEAYYRYGGAGIKMCDEWGIYSNFMKWSVANGYENNLTIDRIDNDIGYSPLNCRWVTPKDQARNRKKKVIYLEAFGEKKPLVDWANDPRCAASLTSLRKRIIAGHSIEFSITASEHETRVFAHAKRSAKYPGKFTMADRGRCQK